MSTSGNNGSSRRRRWHGERSVERTRGKTGNEAVGEATSSALESTEGAADNTSAKVEGLTDETETGVEYGARESTEGVAKVGTERVVSLGSCLDPSCKKKSIF